MTIFRSRRQFCLAAAATIGAGASPLLRAQEPPDDGTWSRDPGWEILKKTRLTTDSRGMVSAEIAPEVKALAGKELVISGFILPIEAAVEFRHFILSRYSPECPFCPVGAPNEVIEVFATTPMRASNYMVFLRGRFGLQNKVEEGLFYRLEGARVA